MDKGPLCVLFKRVFPPRIELGAFRVLGGCDNHYTTETINTLLVLSLIGYSYLSSSLVYFCLSFTRGGGGFIGLTALPQSRGGRRGGGEKSINFIAYSRFSSPRLE